MTMFAIERKPLYEALPDFCMNIIRFFWIGGCMFAGAWFDGAQKSKHTRQLLWITGMTFVMLYCYAFLHHQSWSWTPAFIVAGLIFTGAPFLRALIGYTVDMSTQQIDKHLNNFVDDRYYGP